MHYRACRAKRRENVVSIGIPLFALLNLTVKDVQRPDGMIQMSRLLKRSWIAEAGGPSLDEKELRHGETRDPRPYPKIR